MVICPNEKQQQCIDNINGKYLVLAGPGTGKTFTIIQRIKSMIERGIPPEKILCLTFTTAAANEMKLRLEKELNTVLSNIDVFTYHGFCHEILENYAEDFNITSNFTVIPEPVSRAFVKECIEELKPKAYRNDFNNPYPYINTILDGINEIKKYRIQKEDYFYNIKYNLDWEPELIRLKNELETKLIQCKKEPKVLKDNVEAQEKKVAKAKELWSFYELYNEKMRENNYLDFDDIINIVLEKFEKNSAFLDKVANKYEYILVDEYQDTNKSQNEIVFQLTKALKTQNVFVVGDDDQIIYSFQGAKLDTIENFLKTFPETEVICLDKNMRSTQNILDISREIANQDPNCLKNNPDFAKYNIIKDLTATNKEVMSKNNKVRCNKYNMLLQEYLEIVNEIYTLVNSDECPVDEKGIKKLSEIAILTRTNAELETFSELLKAKGIPYEMKDGKSIFTIKASLVLYAYMKMLVNPELHSDKIFRLLLSHPFNINSMDYEYLCQNRSKEKSAIDMMKNIDMSKLKEPEKLTKFLKIYDYLQEYRINETLKNVVLEIGAKTGIVEYYLNSDINRVENIAGLKKLIDEASGFAQVNKTITLEDFVEYLDIALNDNIEINTEKAPVVLNSVQLLTYYSAKGREFEYVYMPTLIDRKWESDNKSLKAKIPLSPDEYKTKDQLKIEKFTDRIKVMYVGMTRAKHTLRLSYIVNDNGKVKKVSSLIDKVLSKLNNNNTSIGDKMINWILERLDLISYVTITDDNEYWDEMANYVTKCDYDYTKEFSELVNGIIKSNKYSPSAINKYLNCPRAYFYYYILDLKTKDRNPDALSYGKAIHAALEDAVEYAKVNSKYPTINDILKTFNIKLDAEPMSSYEQRIIHKERGEKMLKAFYPHFIQTPVKNLYKTEFQLNFELDNINFNGIIDRIDQNDDGSLVIYDYKTGKAKGKNKICSNGEYEDYYNQIALYKYFMERTGKKVKETTFIFPEEFENNLTLELSNEDCEAVVEKFKQAIDNIKVHKFAPTDNKDHCKYCPYKDFCCMQVV